MKTNIPRNYGLIHCKACLQTPIKVDKYDKCITTTTNLYWINTILEYSCVGCLILFIQIYIGLFSKTIVFVTNISLFWCGKWDHQIRLSWVHCTNSMYILICQLWTIVNASPPRLWGPVTSQEFICFHEPLVYQIPKHFWITQYKLFRAIYLCFDMLCFLEDLVTTIWRIGWW